ncbi:ankyrin repeat domain-containing protein [Spirochaeta cellobiosiphila]|uniref:ankyrin repeat domain-containing protein n=1 Tax=Spirochaeta cellobiosiphila TaxID=504483 RepID=UPI000406DAC9|nr:ankyrin repeat domain-containing protein [Spirochaeta cellobiosiphila]
MYKKDMHLLVIYNSLQLNNLNLVENNCKSLGIKITKLPWDRDWDIYSRTRLDELIREVDHLLIISDQLQIQGNISHFLIGVFVGRLRKIIMMMPAQADLLPENWPEFLFISNTMDLFTELKTLQKEWQKEQRRIVGVNRLHDLGIEVSSYSLFEAVASGNLAVVEAFLEAGFSENTKNTKGVFLVNEAVRKGHYQLVEFLLNRGCKLNQPSEDRSNTPVMDAAAENQIDILELLLSWGAEVDHVSKNGQSALMLAIGQGHYDIAKKLIDAGANYLLKDKLGMDALTYCKLFKHDEILKYLDPLIEGN